MWAQRATVTDPERNEALIALVEYLRERGEYYKAWHYLLRADREKPPQKLFLKPTATSGASPTSDPSSTTGAP